MTFKKYLGKSNKKGQASLEYFITFAIIVLISVLTLTNYHTDIVGRAQDFFNAVIGKNGLNVRNEANE